MAETQTASRTVKPARTVAEIIEDMEKEKKQSGNKIDLGSTIKNSITKKGKAVVQKASDAAVDKVGDIALDAALGAATGGAVSTKDFKNTNKKGIGGKILGLAGTAAMGVVAKNVGGDLIDAIKGDDAKSGEKSEVKDKTEGKLEVPPTNNLSAQSKIISDNKQAGRKTKALQYTDDQLGKLSDTDKAKLVDYEAFVKNPLGEAFNMIKTDKLASIYGAFALNPVQAVMKHKNLPEKDNISNDLFYDSTFADTFSNAVSEVSSEPSVSSGHPTPKTPEPVVESAADHEQERINREQERAERLERARRQAAMADAAFSIQEEQPSIDSPSFGGF